MSEHDLSIFAGENAKSQKPKAKEDKNEKQNFFFLRSLFFLSWYLFFGIWFFPMMAFAQPSQSSPQDAPLQAIITGPSDVAVGRTIVLDAGSSRTSGEKVSYQWFLGDSRLPVSRAVQAVYTPERPGTIAFRVVVTLTKDGQTQTSEALHTLTVYNRKVVLIADASVAQEKITLHEHQAASAGVFLRVIRTELPSSLAAEEDALTTQISDQSEALGGANATVLWTEGVEGLQALVRAVQGKDGLVAAFENQTIVVVTEHGLSTVARTAQGPYSVLKPQQILVTRPEALPLLLSAESTDAFLKVISQRDIDAVSVDATTAGFHVWNVLTFLVNAMLAHGVPTQTVILLLVLPIIATILAFFKQVVGITSFGLYTPSIIALSLLALGWQIGILFLLFIIVTGYATREVMSRWRLLYIPKVAIILTVVSVTLLLLMGTSAALGYTFSRETVFILLILSTLAESFINLKTEEGWRAAVLGITETVAVALVCVFIVQWGWFQSLLLAYPELILLTIVANAFLGRWTGLRLVEYFRFREVFRHLQEE